MTIPDHIWVPIAVVVSVIAALAFWWWWPKWQVNRLALEIRDPKARADVEDNFRKTVGQLLGGAAVLFGAWLAFLQFSQQQQIAQSQIQQQEQAARDLLISNQVSKGFEQLASDKTAMRLGGIYALEGVMNTSERPEQYRGPVLEMLCAFVREYTIGKTVSEKPAIDIQAALTVIGRRKGSELPDLAKASIPGANLSRANLRGAKNLIQTQLNEACGNNETDLPEGLDPKLLKPCPPITIPPQAP
jgi:Pentapeptide repeats (8 copies)